VTLIIISTSEPQDPPETAVRERQSFLFDPIRTMLSTREARGRLAISRAEQELCGVNPCHSFGIHATDAIFQFDLPRNTLGLPLSWKLSRDRMGRMSAQIGWNVDCTAIADPAHDGESDGNPYTATVVARPTTTNVVTPQTPDGQGALAQARGYDGCLAAVLLSPLELGEDPTGVTVDQVVDH
jgi:hypothetical protein